MSRLLFISLAASIPSPSPFRTISIKIRSGFIFLALFTASFLEKANVGALYPQNFSVRCSPIAVMPSSSTINIVAADIEISTPIDFYPKFFRLFLSSFI